MILDALEKQAKADKRNEHEITHRTSGGALVVIWDGVFEYYEITKCGEWVDMDRDAAIDHLNNIEYLAHQRTANA